LNGRNIPFINNVKFLGVIFNKRITCKLHIEMTEAKAFGTFIRICSLFKSECLSDNIKLTLHKALIRSGMTYTCPAWELAADTYLVKLQRLQNKVLRTTGNFPRCTPVRDLHMAFSLLYIYDYITDYAGNEQKSYRIMRMNIFAGWDKVKPDIENTRIRGLNLEVIKLMTIQVTKLLL
jgi:hypothetical protein